MSLERGNLVLIFAEFGLAVFFSDPHHGRGVRVHFLVDSDGVVLHRSLPLVRWRSNAGNATVFTNRYECWRRSRRLV